MIFSCENLDSQSVSKGNFRQAIPPSYLSNRMLAVKLNPVGVITPHFIYDCTANRPKQPTFLPADTCLTLEVGHSLYITEPVICSDGRTALVQTYNEPNCEFPSSWLGETSFLVHTMTLSTRNVTPQMPAASHSNAAKKKSSCLRIYLNTSSRTLSL
jgi:hypothetical protein